MLLCLLTAVTVAVMSADRDSKKRRTDIEGKTPVTTSVPSMKAETTELEESSVVSEREITAESSNAKKEKYSLMASVVKRNINIMITDEDGQAVSGKEFHVFLRNEDGISSEYADFDLDGFIHAIDVPSGSYTISLASTEDYRMAASVDVKVRDVVEYSAISRVISLIKNESEIDSEKEDTANMREEDDGSLLESGGIDLDGGSVGIDVSRYNKEIDWKTVKESGVEFAIIRLGYRGSSTGVLVEDSMFQKNYEEAKAAGMKIGVYFVTQAMNEEEAEEEAEMVAALTEASDLSTPVFLDVENSGGRGDTIGREKRTENINAFCRKIEELGYRAGVYANKRWFNKEIVVSSLGNWKIWLAQYKVRTPDYEGKYDIWQYSSKGHVDGIEGNVDLNLYLGNVDN